MGTEGSIFFEKGRIIKAYACTKDKPEILEDWKVVDTVGAGDAFMSGFCRMHTKCDWSQGDYEQQMKDCLWFANICGFITVCRTGAQSSPTLSEVNAFISKYNL